MKLTKFGCVAWEIEARQSGYIEGIVKVRCCYVDDTFYRVNLSRSSHCQSTVVHKYSQSLLLKEITCRTQFPEVVFLHQGR